LNPHQHAGNAIETVAAQWLARRDRGLSATEQDAYLHWLQEKPEHGIAIAKLERSWDRLNRLRGRRPAHHALPNPDLLVHTRRQGWRWWGIMGAAAALVLTAMLWPPARPPRYEPARGVVVHPAPERMELADGTVVTLNAGAKVEAHFSVEERRVRLIGGEAHFAVAKNPARSFVVDAGDYTVSAVGTAFAVQLDRADLSVLVTEGLVRLNETAGGNHAADESARALAQLGAGQHALVRGQSDAKRAVVVRDLASAEVELALVWQGTRLEFADVPLRDVVAEFNRFNTQKLVIGSAETGEIAIGGIFRADNLDTFVRLLGVGFDVAAEPRGNEIVLRRRD
jgi:transmembrane sensor